MCVCGCGTPSCSSSCFVKCEFNTCDLTFLGELRQLRRNLHKLRIRPVLACHIRLPHCHSPFSVAAAALCRALGEHLSDTMLRCFVCLVEQLSDPATLVASLPFALCPARCCLLPHLLILLAKLKLHPSSASSSAKQLTAVAPQLLSSSAAQQLGNCHLHLQSPFWLRF